MTLPLIPQNSIIPPGVPPAWMRQVFPLPRGCHGAASGPLGDGMALALDAYGARAAGPESGLLAVGYCWRRFGPPWLGSDEYKDLVTYVLGTPHPEVFLSLHLSASPLPYGVGYLVTKALQAQSDAPRVAWEAAFEVWWWAHKASPEDGRLLEQHRALCNCSTVERDNVLVPVSTHYWDDRLNHAVRLEAEVVIGPMPRRDEEAGRPIVEQAITGALLELLRPVYVRDIAINILGRLADEDIGADVIAAEPSPYAGYGVPKAAMDTRIAKEEEGS